MFQVKIGSSFDKWTVVYIGFSYEAALDHSKTWMNYCKLADELGLHKSWALTYPIEVK